MSWSPFPCVETDGDGAKKRVPTYLCNVDGVRGFALHMGGGGGGWRAHKYRHGHSGTGFCRLDTYLRGHDGLTEMQLDTAQ